MERTKHFAETKYSWPPSHHSLKPTYDDILAYAKEVNALCPKSKAIPLSRLKEKQLETARANLKPEHIMNCIGTCCDGTRDVIILLVCVNSFERAAEIVTALAADVAELPSYMTIEAISSLVVLRILIDETRDRRETASFGSASYSI